MVDVAGKDVTQRVARAAGRIRMRPATLRRIAAGAASKGDVLGVARIAAIQAAKRTAELIPLCHPLALTHVAVDFTLERKASAVRLRGDRRHDRAHRGRDGGADRGGGGPAHDLRHVQGRRPRHAPREHRAAREKGRQIRSLGRPHAVSDWPAMRFSFSYGPIRTRAVDAHRGSRTNIVTRLSDTGRNDEPTAQNLPATDRPAGRARCRLVRRRSSRAAGHGPRPGTRPASSRRRSPTP